MTTDETEALRERVAVLEREQLALLKANARISERLDRDAAASDAIVLAAVDAAQARITELLADNTRLELARREATADAAADPASCGEATVRGAWWCPACKKRPLWTLDKYPPLCGTCRGPLVDVEAAAKAVLTDIEETWIARGDWMERHPELDVDPPPSTSTELHAALRALLGD